MSECCMISTLCVLFYAIVPSGKGAHGCYAEQKILLL